MPLITSPNAARSRRCADAVFEKTRRVVRIEELGIFEARFNAFVNVPVQGLDMIQLFGWLSVFAAAGHLLY